MKQHVIISGSHYGNKYGSGKGSGSCVGIGNPHFIAPPQYHGIGHGTGHGFKFGRGDGIGLGGFAGGKIIY